MKRSQPLRRSGAAPGAKRGIGRTEAPKARQRPLRAVSPQREAERAARAAVRVVVFTRDGGCVLRDDRSVPPCYGPATFHHLRKASAGGGYTARNGVCLCAGHNDWVEDFPAKATALGLVRR